MFVKVGTWAYRRTTSKKTISNLDVPSSPLSLYFHFTEKTTKCLASSIRRIFLKFSHSLLLYTCLEKLMLVEWKSKQALCCCLDTSSSCFLPDINRSVRMTRTVTLAIFRCVTQVYASLKDKYCRNMFSSCMQKWHLQCMSLPDCALTENSRQIRVLLQPQRLHYY